MPIYHQDQGKSGALKLYLGLVVFSLLGSLASRLTGLDPGIIAPIASILTLVLGVIVLALPAMNRLGKKFVYAIIWVLILGAVVEIAGIYTGLPFGKYEYTNVWLPVVSLPGPHFFPVLLPFAWFLIVGGCFLTFNGRFATFSTIFLTALVSTIIDIPMEFVMVQVLKYWKWLDPVWPIGPGLFGAPLMNMVGWFSTSLVAAIFLKRGMKENDIDCPEAPWVLCGHLILVLGLGFIHYFVRQPVWTLGR